MKVAHGLVGALLAAMATVVACGGKTVGDGGQMLPNVDRPDCGQCGSLSCIDVEATASDGFCEKDSDCTLGSTGNICSGDCLCGDTPMSNAAAARINRQVSVLTFQACGCGAPGGDLSCQQGHCTLRPLSGTPEGGVEAGPEVSDAGPDAFVDSGPIAFDSGLSAIDSPLDAVDAADGGPDVVTVLPADAGSGCAGLASCCVQLPSSSAGACNAIVAEENASVCQQELNALQASGSCETSGTGSGS